MNYDHRFSEARLKILKKERTFEIKKYNFLMIGIIMLFFLIFL